MCDENEGDRYEPVTGKYTTHLDLSVLSLWVSVRLTRTGEKKEGKIKTNWLSLRCSKNLCQVETK